MSNKKIIIHCGMPKTGSSALQVQLAQSRGSFLKHGYDYLNVGAVKEAKEGRITSGNGKDLAAAYMPPTRPGSDAKNRAEVTRQIRRAISNTKHHVILSSEFFAPIPARYLGELVTALSDLGDVQLVYFVREQVNAIASGYIQSVKRAQMRQFPDEFFANLDLSKRPHLAYKAYFKQRTEEAPDATILVKPYELSKTHPAGLMGLFLDMIGAKIPVEDLPVDSHINLSPSPQEIRLMIELNKYKPRARFSDMVVEASRVAARSEIFTDHAIIPPKFVAEIRARYADGNEYFFANFAKCENIYKNIDRAVSFTDLRDVTFEASDVLDILLGLLVNMDHRIGRLEKN